MIKPKETIGEWWFRTTVRPRRIRHRKLFEYRQSLIPPVRISLRGWWAKAQALGT